MVIEKKKIPSCAEMLYDKTPVDIKTSRNIMYFIPMKLSNS